MEFNKPWIIAVNLIAVCIWFFLTVDNVHNRNEARQLTHQSLSAQGVLTDREMLSQRYGGPAMVYHYSFTVDGKPYTNAVSFERGSKGDHSISHVKPGGALSVLYDRKDPNISLPEDVADYYQTVSPWNLIRLIEVIVFANGILIVFAVRSWIKNR